MQNGNRINPMLSVVGWAFALLIAGGSGAQEFDPDQNFNAELWEFTGENPAARNVYKCTECTFEQVLAVPLPGDNWDKNVSEDNRRLFFPDATNDAPSAPPGTASSLDLVPEIPGDDHFLIARVLSSSILGIGAQGIIGLGQVDRGTTLTYSVGQVIHTVTSPQADEYVMFSMSESRTETFDPFVPDGLAEMSVPTGWLYSSEVLSEELVVITPGGTANVFSVPGWWNWQEVIVAPEPSTGLLSGVALGIAALLAGRPRR